MTISLNTDSYENMEYQILSGTILDWAANAKLPSCANVCVKYFPDDVPLEREMNLLVFGFTPRKTVIATIYNDNNVSKSIYTRNLFYDGWLDSWHKVDLVEM